MFMFKAADKLVNNPLIEMKPTFSSFSTLILLLSAVKCSLPDEPTEVRSEAELDLVPCFKEEASIACCEQDDSVSVASAPLREISYDYFGTAPIIKNPSAPRDFTYGGNWIQLSHDYSSSPRFNTKDTFEIPRL